MRRDLDTGTLENLWDSFEHAFDGTTTRIVVVLLLGLAALAGWRMWVVWAVAKRARAASGGQSLADDVGSLRKRLVDSRLPHLAAAVANFERSLVIVAAARPRRTVGADHCVTHEVLTLEAGPTRRAFLFPAVSVESLDQVASWCTGLGILGTFVGVSMGLEHIADALGGEGVSTLVEPVVTGANGVSTPLDASIGKVVADLSTAFWTSILGVICAMVIGFLARRTYDLVERTHADLCARLEALTDAPAAGPNALADVTAQVLRDAADSEFVTAFIDREPDNTLDQLLQTAVERVLENPALGSLMNSAVGALNQRFDAFAKAIGDRVAMSQRLAEDHVRAFTKQAVSHIGAAVKDSMSDMAGEFKELRDGARDLALQLAQSSVESSELQQAMRDSAALSRESLTAVGNVSRGMETLGVALHDSLAKTTAELDAFGQQIGRSLQTVLNETLTTTTSIRRHLGDLASGSDALAQALETLPGVVTAIGGLQQGVFAQLEQNQTKVAETFARLEGQLRESQSQQATKLGETFTTAQRQINAGLEGLVRQTTQSRDALGLAVQQLERLLGGMGDSIGRLQETAGNLRGASTEARQMAASQATMQIELRQTLERLALFSNDIRMLPATNQVLTQHLEKLATGFDTLQTSLDAVSAAALSESLQELREAVSGAAPGLVGNLRGVSERLVEVRDALRTAPPTRVPALPELRPSPLQPDRAVPPPIRLTKPTDSAGS
jgi:hypothetical protein